MRIRSFLIGALAAALTLLAVAGIAIVGAARAEDEADRDQTRAQAVAHEVTALLSLAQEYARYQSPRAAEQWHQMQRSIAALLDGSDRDRSDDAMLGALRDVGASLPELFARLEAIPPDGDAFALRRQEMLLDQLLASTQAMSDDAARWYLDARQARRAADARFERIAIATPVAMLAMLVVVAWFVRSRILLPVKRLAAAAARIGAGDLGHRIADPAHNELGELARRFDAMTAALAASQESARQSARHLREVADNLPALVAYVDRDETYRFVNAHYRTVYGVDPASFVGTTIAQSLGAAARASMAREIEGALRGERQTFERHGVVRHSDAAREDTHLLVNFIPDIGVASRSVDGFYVMVSDITARKTAELAQARGERQLRMITDNLPTMIAYLDRDLRYRFASAEYRRHLQLDPAALLGRSVLEAFGAGTHDVVRPHLDAALRGERRRIERVARSGDRESVLLSEYIPDVDERGEIVGLYAMTIDVTERRQAEARLRASEQRLRAITDNIPAMIGHFDTGERCRFANATVLALHGLTQDDIPRHTLRSGIGEDAYALHRPHVEAALRGETRTFEGHVVRHGRDAYFQAHVVPDHAPDGSVRGFYTMSFDITAVRRAEIARVRSEERLRKITDNLPVLIAYIDRAERIGFANRTYATWLGIDPATMVGRALGDTIPQQAYDARIGHARRAMQGERVDFEGELVACGTTRTTQTSYIPDIGADGEVAGIYALTTDVTSLKQVEQQLRAMARFDTLTGLPNRMHYNEKLQEALDRANRSQHGLALLFLDIDRFKLINDSLGHAAGDAVLQEFAARLKRSVRLTDTVARLAGDEFVIVVEALHHADEPQAIAAKIVAAMQPPFLVGEHLLAVTTSIGVSYHEPTSQTTPAALLDRADKALYDAKSAGRNTHRMAS